MNEVKTLLTQDELLNRLMSAFRRNPQTITYVAKEIGISSISLRNFLNGKTKSLDFRTRLLIENYIYNKEEKHENNAL